MDQSHDVVVIGGGPGGYVAAIRAAQLGLDTACVEKEPALGGTCLRIGCIPSKALLESSELYSESLHAFESHGIHVGDVKLDLERMLARKSSTVDGLTKGIAGLFKKNEISHYVGTGRLDGDGNVLVEGEEPTRLAAANVILATGSVSAPLEGVELDGDLVGTSTEALAYPEVPESLLVIGAGAIGLELGSVWARLGSRVTVLEYMDRILPGMEEDLAKEALRIFKRQGLAFELGARVTSAKVTGSGAEACTVEIEGKEPFRASRVLLAVGRKPYTDGLGLETVGLSVDERGRIEVDERFQTKTPNIFAIGDVIRGPMLAHKAEDEGVACAEGIAGMPVHVNYDAIPNIVYTMPEVASVGKTSAELDADGVPYRSGVFPFAANGRARALGHTDGRVKILAHEETDRVLGVHILGPRAGDLIAEAAVAIEFGASSEDIARSCHAHPTLAEVVKEAALAVDGRQIHM